MAWRDEAAFREFAEATTPLLRRTAYLMCGDVDRAADIVQEALIKVYVAWPRLDRSQNLRGYARRAVMSAAIDMSRRRSSTERVGLVAAEEPSTEDLAGRVTEHRALVQALATLPPRQRACVVLRYLEDLAVVDVAAALGCQVGTVKSHTAKGLTALRAAYGGQLEVEREPVGEGGAR